MKLKEILNKRYDKEFPISGSFGTSIDTLIILDKEGPSDYVGTEYAIIKYITEIQKVTWRRLTQALLIHNDRYIDHLTIRTLKTTDKHAIPQIEDYYFDIDYFFRKNLHEMEAAKTFDKEKTLTLILQRLEEIRHQNEFNRKCIKLLKAGKLLDDYILFSQFIKVLCEDSSFHLLEAMSNIGKVSMINVFRELAPRLK